MTKKLTKRQEALVQQTLQNAVVAVRDIPNSALAEFLPKIEEAKNILLRDLKAFELKEGGATRYTAHRHRSAIVQLDAALREIRGLGPEMAATLTNSGGKAAIAGVNAMEMQLASMDAMFTGAMVPVSIDRAAVLSRGEGLLLRRYPSSGRRYAGAIEGDVRRHLTLGVLRQQSISQVANAMYDAIPEVFKSAKHNAERLVRTEIMYSYNSHHHESLIDAHSEDDEIKMRWDASYDFRRCPTCADLDGKIVEVDKEFVANWTTKGGMAKSSSHRQPPAHPRCFVPGTEVQGEFVAGLKAWYSGEMVELRVKSGRSVAVTANHPILTDSGWIAAGKITEDHRLLRYGGDVDGASSTGSLNKENPPSRIDDVFRLFRGSGSTASCPTSAGDLHGDATFVDGDVEIVWADRPFKGAFNGHELRDFSRPVTDPALVVESGLGSKLKLGARLNPSSGCAVGGCDLHHLSPVGHARPFHSLCLGLASELNSGLQKPATDDPSANAEFLRELIDRGSGKVAFDDVVEIRKFDYSGHVYDLQSVSGWLVAGGIIASNCRCVLVPWMSDWPDSDWNVDPPDEGEPAPEATMIFGRGVRPEPKILPS